METIESLNHKIKNEGLEKSAQNYEQATETLALIAKEISGLSVPEETIQNWKTLLRAMRVADDKLDHIVETEKRLDFQKQIEGFLRGENIDFSNNKDLEKSMLNIRNLSTGLDENRKQFFLSSLLRLLKCTEKIKIEENSKKLVDLTRLEGQATIKVFLPFLPEEFRQSSNYSKLVHALTRFCRAANTFDTFVDLPTDYKNEQIKVHPNALNRALFLGAVISDSLSVLKDTGLSKDLAKLILVNIKRTAQSNSDR